MIGRELNSSPEVDRSNMIIEVVVGVGCGVIADDGMDEAVSGGPG